MCIRDSLDLVTDICKRNGIKKLVWSTKKADRVNHKNGCILDGVPRTIAQAEAIETMGIRIDKVLELQVEDLSLIHISYLWTRCSRAA